jgi:hypothetical protein
MIMLGALGVVMMWFLSGERVWLCLDHAGRKV